MQDNNLAEGNWLKGGHFQHRYACIISSDDRVTFFNTVKVDQSDYAYILKKIPVSSNKANGKYIAVSLSSILIKEGIYSIQLQSLDNNGDVITSDVSDFKTCSNTRIYNKELSIKVPKSFSSLELVIIIRGPGEINFDNRNFKIEETQNQSS